MFFLTAGCVVEPGLADTEGDASGASTSMTSTTSTTSTTFVTDDDTSSTSATDDAATTSTTSTTDGSSDETTGPPPPSFDCPPADGDYQCDLALQDCPDGFKCILWDAEGDVLEPDGIVCAPIDERPVELYQSCTNDVAACTDDCPGDAACLSIYGEGAACLNQCDENDACPGDQVCKSCGSCWTAWCVPTCDPLAPDCPATAGSCALGYDFGQTAFSCEGPPPGPGGAGEPCGGDPWSCGESLQCASQEVLGPDCLDLACCTELCSLLDPGAACSNPAHVCIPLFIPGQALPSQEHIGQCALPEAHPCNTPGLCPPPGIDDDAYPWCSTDNENACDDGIFGFGGGPMCTQGCLCIDQCVTDADCPVPATGTAAPECWDNGPGFENDRCILPCGGGEVCPDGMTCAPEWGDICMWVSPDEC